MGYKKICNLYKPEAIKAIMQLDECYALEKIHGTSANVRYVKNQDEKGITFFSGGIKHDDFEKWIDNKFGTLDHLGCHVLRAQISMYTSEVEDFEEIIFYGEAYGGKCQKMRDVYGELNFIVFEVKLNGVWLNVPEAEMWAKKIGFDFVYYDRGPATIEWLDSQRDRPSEQAKRNGIGDDKIGEGIVIRATDESIKDRFGNRILAKHKRPEFRETKTPRKIDPEQQRMWTEAQETADEFVVAERLNHVLDKLVATKPGFEMSMKNTRTVIGAMTGDIRKEEGDTIKWSSMIQRAIGSKTAKLFKQHLNNLIKEKNI